ncbi:MAG: protein TolR [Brachymonas denitrificans]|jgi:biopolymer transport protein TolR|uniref:protein TolR n=1 Tax=Brachymonas denitrificans TaxID=28220 RepID=UPI002AFF7D28|nr:protein TolR [Brachymonas denitrificans]
MPALVSRGRGRRTINEINMVPFIDVMLVLLIIFMVTAPLIRPGTINLPSVSKSSQQAADVVQVEIKRDGTLALHGKTASSTLQLDTVASAVQEAQAGDPARPVVISADREVQYDQVIQVMDRLRQAGVQRIGLAAAARS